MKTVKELMTTDVIWVSPSAKAKSAVLLAKGHNIGALPVVHADEAVVGLITERDLLGVEGDISVTEIMQTDYVTIDPETTAFDAAERMEAASASHVLVVENSRLVGIVAASDLMPELGRNFDPLTGLQWSDSFREWAMSALKRGIEISVIFFDLNQFGKFNKLHGHVVGDNVIKEAAEVIKNGINWDTDFACRYGGDEFVVVSSRLADEANQLAEELQNKISKIKIPEIPEGISAAYGMFGGRRTKEREDIHYSATIDDLITRASKNCTANKPGRTEQVSKETPQAAATQAAPEFAAPAAGRRLKIGAVSMTTTEAEAFVSVTLLRGDKEYKRDVSGYVVGGKNILRLIAEAAAGAACKSLPPGYGISVEGVTVHSIGPDDEIVSVATTFISPRWSNRHVGSAIIRRGDQYRTTVAALLSSVNRLLEAAPETANVDMKAPAEE